MRSWVRISTSCEKSWPWLCIPVTAALASRNRQILSAGWPDTLAKMGSFQFSERPFLKARRQKVAGRNSSSSSGLHMGAHIQVCATHRHPQAHVCTYIQWQQQPAKSLLMTWWAALVDCAPTPLPFLCATATLVQPELSSCLGPLHWLPIPLLGIETGLPPSLPSGVFSNVTCSRRFPEYHTESNAPLFHPSPWLIFLFRTYPYMMFYHPVKLYRASPLQ